MLTNFEIVKKFKIVLLVREGGNQKMPPAAALRIAESEGLDLICVSENQENPVCKVGDYKKMIFDQKKREKDAKKNQTQTKVKEVQISAVIADHDLETKIRATKRFIESGDIVKFSMRLNGRMIQSANTIGRAKMEKAIELCSEFAKIKTPIRVDGRFVTAIIEKK